MRAFSPLLLFLLLYFISSLIAGDFYAIPISAVFLISSMFALLISAKGKNVEQRIHTFTRGASDKNILLMIWIFILSGAFAATAKQIGAIDATVNLALALLPGKLIYAGLFLAACFISMSIGTSVGTVVALVPIAAGIATQLGVSVGFMVGIVVGGAFFGDNMSFISDTTVAATKMLGCEMRDKFKANFAIAFPAALFTFLLYLVLGWNLDAQIEIAKVQWYKLIPYLCIIVLAFKGMHVSLVLFIGIAVNAIIGFSSRSMNWVEWLSSMGSGISSMGDLIIVTLMAGGLLSIIKENKGIESLIKWFTRRVKSKIGAEFSIASMVGLANVCTANNTIAIITTGSIAKDISETFNLNPKRVASILDIFSCIVQSLLPYGAQILMATGLAGISSVEIIPNIYYTFALFVVAVLSIIFRFPKAVSS